MYLLAGMVTSPEPRSADLLRWIVPARYMIPSTAAAPKRIAENQEVFIRLSRELILQERVRGSIADRWLRPTTRTYVVISYCSHRTAKGIACGWTVYLEPPKSESIPMIENSWRIVIPQTVVVMCTRLCRYVPKASQMPRDGKTAFGVAIRHATECVPHLSERH